MCRLAVCALMLTLAQPPAGWPAVRAFHEQRIGEAGIVVSSIALVRDGAIVASAFAGAQDAAGRPVDADTIYHWASVTKMFTAVAIVQLRDRGLLSLDDPVVRYVPELRQVHSGHGDVAQVTIRHLLSHSGGFRASTWPWGGSQPWHPFEPTRWEQLAAMLPYTELLFAPGSRYGYSNPGIVFLGRIIEQLSGDEYETYVTKHILMPLGMTRTFYDRAPPHLRPHRSHSFVVTDEGRREAPFDFDTGITASNGGLNAPIGDMAKWLAFLIGAPRQPVYDLVLERASLEEMFRPVIRARDGEGGSGPDVQAGLGCFIERHEGEELIGHSGDQNGFIVHLYLHPRSRSGYLAAFNTSVASTRDPRRSTRAVDNELRDLIVREVFRPGR